MAFLVSQALEIIVPVLDALLAARPTLSATVRQQVEDLVRLHGPQVATVSAWDAPVRIAAFLDDLSLLRPALPASVVAALDAGGRTAGLRTAPALSPEQRKEVLERLVALADFRVFAAPSSLAQEVMALVSRHLDRLLDEERAGWEALVADFQRTGDANAFLHGVSRLLAGYPAVRTLLDARRQWAPGPVYRGATLEALTPKGIPGEAVPVPPSLRSSGLPAPAAESADEVVRVARRHGLVVHMVSNAWMRVSLKPMAERGVSVHEVVDRLRRQMPSVPGARMMVGPDQDIRLSSPFSNSQQELLLLSDDLRLMASWAAKITTAMENMPEVTEVNGVKEEGTQQVVLTIDRETAQRRANEIVIRPSTD